MGITAALDTNSILSKEELKKDKKNCVKIGPVGLGEKAVYLNSFYISRMYYVPYSSIRRIYKRIAMSEGGYTGKGAFGAIPYLVAELKDGRTKQCNFKYENEVDQVLSYLEVHHPEIALHSLEAQKRLDEAQRLEKGRFKTELPAKASASIAVIKNAQEYLDKRADLTDHLMEAAGKKRVQDTIPVSSRVLAILMFAGSVAALAAGLPLTFLGRPYGAYFLLFGMAFLIFALSSRLVPIGSNSPKAIEQNWEKAVNNMQDYINEIHSSEGAAFPVPAKYAHPTVCARMVRVIREGRAVTPEEALVVVKEDLKALNHEVKVSREEYNEVKEVKPMFLISDYQ